MYSELVVHRLDNWSDREVAHIPNPYLNQAMVRDVLDTLNKRCLGRCFYTWRDVTHTAPDAQPGPLLGLREAKDMDFAACMDVLDWFDDSELYEYLQHNSVAKSDADERIGRVLPMLRNRAQMLIDIHAGTESAYPSVPA